MKRKTRARVALLVAALSSLGWATLMTYEGRPLWLSFFLSVLGLLGGIFYFLALASGGQRPSESARRAVARQSFPFWGIAFPAGVLGYVGGAVALGRSHVLTVGAMYLLILGAFGMMAMATRLIDDAT